MALAEIFFDALLGAVGVGLEFVNPGGTFDLFQHELAADIRANPTIDGECVLSIIGRPGAEDPTFVAISAEVKCGEEGKLVGSWINVPVGQELAFSDERVGDISITFQTSNTNEYPFPGETIIKNPFWTERGWGDSMGVKDCISLSGKGLLEGKDCKGEETAMRVCADGFPDDSPGLINEENIQKHGWVQLMAMPQKNKDPACNPDAKIKRTLSRFTVE